MLESEVKPLSTLFDGSGTALWPNYINPANPAASFSEIWDNLEAGTPHHWRMRLRFDPVTTPWMPASRWVTIPWNGWNEADFRTAEIMGTGIYLPLVVR
jgi:hypothetical protein